MAVQLKRHSFTVSEYHKLSEIGILKATDHVELINGEIVTMSPIKSPHAGMVTLLMELLILQLHQQATIICQSPIRLSNHSEPEPDIMVAKHREDKYSLKHPEPKDIHILIEVADTTLDKDREVKQPLYAKANIPEYWIVNLIDRQIEIHRQPKKGEYHFKQIISDDNEVIKTAFKKLKLRYADLFAKGISKK